MTHLIERTDRRAGPRAVTMAAALWTFVSLAGVATAQETPDQAELQALMAKALELGAPGPEHARFESMVGTWDTQMTMWPEPGAEAVIVNGTTESELILGGRYLLQAMTIAEGYFAGEAVNILGFDRRSGEYTLIGLDTVGTYWVTGQGPATGDDEAVLSGEDFDPVFNATQEYDFVLRWPDDGSFVTQIVFKDAYHTRGGGPFKMLETVSRRRQQPGNSQ